MSGSVAVAAPVEGGKRGALFGGALTDEALDSSRSVLGTTRFGDVRGLQQFYTPREARARAVDAGGELTRTLARAEPTIRRWVWQQCPSGHARSGLRRLAGRPRQIGNRLRKALVVDRV
jgi:hypothetical protein